MPLTPLFSPFSTEKEEKNRRHRDGRTANTKEERERQLIPLPPLFPFAHPSSNIWCGLPLFHPPLMRLFNDSTTYSGDVAAEQIAFHVPTPPSSHLSCSSSDGWGGKNGQRLFTLLRSKLRIPFKHLPFLFHDGGENGREEKQPIPKDDDDDTFNRTQALILFFAPR